MRTAYIFCGEMLKAHRYIISSLVIFFFSEKAILSGSTEEVDKVNQWVSQHILHRHVQSAIVETEVIRDDMGRIREVLIFDRPLFYKHVHELQRPDGTPDAFYHFWYDGGIFVQKKENGNINIVRSIGDYPDGWEEVTLLANSMCITGVFSIWYDFKETTRVNSADSSVLTYEGALFGTDTELRVIFEFQAEGEPFPVSVSYVATNGLMVQRYEYNGWFLTQGYFFPRELTISHYGYNTGESHTPTKKIYRLHNIEFINDDISSFWFIPKIKNSDNGLEMVLDKQGRMTILSLYEHGVMEKYSHILPPE